MKKRKTDWIVLIVLTTLVGLLFVFFPKGSQQIKYFPGTNPVITGQPRCLLPCDIEDDGTSLEIDSFGIPYQWTPESQVKGVYDEGLEIYSNNWPIIAFNFLAGAIIGASFAVLISLIRKKK